MVTTSPDELHRRNSPITSLRETYRKLPPSEIAGLITDTERLRCSRLAAGVVTVFITTSRFGTGPQYSNSATFELAYSTDSTDELLSWALKGLGQIYRPGFRYKKAGVMLNKLAPAEHLSMRLFGEERFERSRRVMKAVDEINRKFGRDTLRFGAARPGGRWETKFLRRSRRYTTRLSEVLRIAS